MGCLKSVIIEARLLFHVLGSALVAVISKAASVKMEPVTRHA